MNNHPLQIPQYVVEKWQGVVDLLAEVMHVVASLIMKVEPPEIVVLVSSQSKGNPYPAGTRALLDDGLYCETVMKTRQPLLIPNALVDERWQDNPDIRHGMISYLGFPVAWPNGDIFGTICILDDKTNQYNGLSQRLLQQFRDLVEMDLKFVFDLAAREDDSRTRLIELERSRRALLSVLEDMKQTEKALRESEDRFRVLVEQAPEAIVVLDADRSAIVEANRNAQRLFGCDRKTLLNGSLRHFYAPCQPDGLSVEESGQLYIAQAMEQDEVVFERVVRPAHGEDVYCEVHIVRLPSADRRLFRISYLDITARKLAEAERQRAHERLQDIIEFLPDATFVIDKDKRVIAWNRALEEMSGVSKAEMLGQGDYAYAVPFWGCRRPILIDLIGVPNPEVEALYDSFERRNDAIYAETFVPSLYGGVGAYVWAIASPLLDKQGNRYGAIESVRDITDRKRAEEEVNRYRQHLEELVEERTAELAAANRELAERTGQLQALASQLTEAEQRERRRIAYVLHEDLQQLLVATKFSIGLLRDKGYRHAAEQAFESLDRAIEVSRTLTHELRPPVLYELGLGPALEWLGRQARAKYDLAVEVNVVPEAEPASDNLRILLFEAAQGLLLNVVKHAHVNRASVCLSRIDNRVQLLVADPGVGFDPSQRRGGFGLFSIRERLEMLGGRVEVDSAPGRGTRVSLTVPIGGETLDNSPPSS